MKQELAYVSRRVDEIMRYFLTLEHLVGTGAVGSVLEKCLSDVEESLKAHDTLDDVEEVQALIDAAVRLGLHPKRYAPLAKRREWLLTGQRQRDLRRTLADVSSCHDMEMVQQLIDDGVRLSFPSAELDEARRRLRELEQHSLNEEMLAAAAKGQAGLVAAAIRRGANCDASQAKGGHSLWHLAVASGSVDVARLALRSYAAVDQMDDMGCTASMLAVRHRALDLFQLIIEARADLSVVSSPTEVMLECQDAAETAKVRALVGADGRLAKPLDARGVALDIADELLAGEELNLPFFRRVGGRTLMHFAVLRVDASGREVPVIRQLLQHDVVVDACDDLGRTPLWYAAYGGGLEEVMLLLRVGAAASVEEWKSPLVAAARRHEFATAEGDRPLAKILENTCRVLIRHGCTYENSPLFTAELRKAFCEDHLGPEALEFAGGFSAAAKKYAASSAACARRYQDRLLLQRGRLLGSAAVAADFAAGAMLELDAIVLDLASRVGARAILGPTPTARLVKRVARSMGFTQCDEDGAVDWHKVVGASQCALVFPTASTIYEAVPAIESRLGDQIRSWSDTLTKAPPVKSEHDVSTRRTFRRLSRASDASETSERRRRSRASVVRRSSVLGDWDPCSCEVRILLEVDGVVCLMRLRVACLVELEQQRLAEGCWLRQELAPAIEAGSVTKVEEALEAAALHVDTLRTVSGLNMHLGPDRPPPVCAAVLARSPQILGLLLASKASPNARDARGTSALALAVDAQCLPCVSALLLWGAEPKVSLDSDASRSGGVGGDGSGDFHAEAHNLIARVKKQREIDTLALVHWVEGSHSGSVGAGPSKALSTLKRLLEWNADANAWATEPSSGKSMPLLSCAIMCGNSAFMVLLFKHGALVQTGGDDCSALRLAQGTPMMHMVERQANQELQLAVASDNVPAIHALLAAGLNVETMCMRTGTSASTLLTYAVALPLEAATQLIEDLLQRGAAIERRSGPELTPLLAALDVCAPADVVALLLEHGADTMATDPASLTTTMIAAQHGSLENLKLLLEAGAPVDWKDCEDSNAAALAYTAVESECVALLAEYGCALDHGVAVEELFGAVEDEDGERFVALLSIAAQTYPRIACAAEGPQEPTLLMEAVRMQSIDTARVLLSHQALLHPRVEAALAPASTTADGLSEEHQESSSDGEAEKLFDSAWSLAAGNSSMKALLRAFFPSELLRIAINADVHAAADLRAAERQGLIAAPEELELVDADGFNALDHFLLHGLVDCEIWLTERGGRLSGTSAWPPTLAAPAKCADVETVRRRIAAGADVHAIDAEGRNAFDWAVIAGNITGLVWACAEASMDCGKDSKNYRSLFASRDSACSVDGSRNYRSSFASRDSAYSEQGSIEASALGKQERLRASFSSRTTGHRHRRKCAKPDPRGVFGLVEDALLEAGGRLVAVRSATFCLGDPSAHEDVTTVERRIRAGADCRAIAGRSNVAHSAMDARRNDIARKLVANGASPDDVDSRGRTVLWRAIEMQDTALMDVCFGRGADIALGSGNAGCPSVLHMAVDTGQSDVALRLIELDRLGSMELMRHYGTDVAWRAIRKDEMEVARACFKCGVDVNAVEDDTGLTFLHVAVQRDDVGLVHELIRRGAEVQVTDMSGETPLLIATREHSREAVEVLLEAGAQPRAIVSPEVLYAIEVDAYLLARRIASSCVPVMPTKAEGAVYLAKLATNAQAGGALEATLLKMLQGVGMSTAPATSFAQAMRRKIFSGEGDTSERATAAADFMFSIRELGLEEAMSQASQLILPLQASEGRRKRGGDGPPTQSPPMPLTPTETPVPDYCGVLSTPVDWKLQPPRVRPESSTPDVAQYQRSRGREVSAFVSTPSSVPRGAEGRRNAAASARPLFGDVAAGSSGDSREPCSAPGVRQRPFTSGAGAAPSDGLRDARSASGVKDGAGAGSSEGSPAQPLPSSGAGESIGSEEPGNALCVEEGVGVGSPMRDRPNGVVTDSDEGSKDPRSALGVATSGEAAVAAQASISGASAEPVHDSQQLHGALVVRDGLESAAPTPFLANGTLGENEGAEAAIHTWPISKDPRGAPLASEGAEAAAPTQARTSDATDGSCDAFKKPCAAASVGDGAAAAPARPSNGTRSTRAAVGSSGAAREPRCASGEENEAATPAWLFHGGEGGASSGDSRPPRNTAGVVESVGAAASELPNASGSGGAPVLSDGVAAIALAQTLTCEWRTADGTRGAATSERPRTGDSGSAPVLSEGADAAALAQPLACESRSADGTRGSPASERPRTSDPGGTFVLSEGADAAALAQPLARESRSADGTRGFPAAERPRTSDPGGVLVLREGADAAALAQPLARETRSADGTRGSAASERPRTSDPGGALLSREGVDAATSERPSTRGSGSSPVSSEGVDVAALTQSLTCELRSADGLRGATTSEPALTSDSSGALVLSEGADAAALAQLLTCELRSADGTGGATTAERLLTSDSNSAVVPIEELDAAASAQPLTCELRSAGCASRGADVLIAPGDLALSSSADSREQRLIIDSLPGSSDDARDPRSMPGLRAVAEAAASAQPSPSGEAAEQRADPTALRAPGLREEPQADAGLSPADAVAGITTPRHSRSAGGMPPGAAAASDTGLIDAEGADELGAASFDERLTAASRAIEPDEAAAAPASIDDVGAQHGALSVEVSDRSFVAIEESYSMSDFAMESSHADIDDA